MKKISALILAAALVLAAAGCKSESGSGTATTPAETTPAATTPAETTPAETAPADETTPVISDSGNGGDVDGTEEVTEDVAKSMVEQFMKEYVYTEYTLFHAALPFDESDTYNNDYGVTYARVTDNDRGFTCVDDIKSYLNNVYTAEYMAGKYYNQSLEGDYRMYEDKDGALYMNISGGGGGFEDYQYGTTVISSFSRTEIKGTVSGQDGYGSLITANITLTCTDNFWKISALDVIYEN